MKVAGAPCTVEEVSIEGDMIRCKTGKPSQEQLSVEVFPGKYGNSWHKDFRRATHSVYLGGFPEVFHSLNKRGNT